MYKLDISGKKHGVKQVSVCSILVAIVRSMTCSRLVHVLD